MSGGDRAPVAKTYKLYVGGAFIRSEGGKVLEQRSPDGAHLAHVARATRKDARDAIARARAALPGWKGLHALLRGQILFRLAEMLEDRRPLLEAALVRWTGCSAEDAARQATAAVERTFWYAGWTDKFGSVLGNVNPVSGPYFNFTVPEPVGVVALAAPASSPLLGLVSTLLPVLASGNTCVLVVDHDARSIAVDVSEAIAVSDVPAGVVNVLTGHRAEVLPTLASHMDVDALALSGASDAEAQAAREAAADNLKRVRVTDDRGAAGWLEDGAQSPYRIEAFVEWKTAWHPMGT